LHHTKFKLHDYNAFAMCKSSLLKILRSLFSNILLSLSWVRHVLNRLLVTKNKIKFHTCLKMNKIVNCINKHNTCHSCKSCSILGTFQFCVSLHTSRSELTLGHPFILLKYLQNVHGLIYASWQFNSISIYLYAKTLVKDPIVGHKNRWIRWFQLFWERKC